MSFKVGDIPLFDKYLFTDTGKVVRHFGLMLLPETATQYQNSLLCCVITSKITKHWSFLLESKNYPFFKKDSWACFNRKDLVSMDGLADGLQPRGRLRQEDIRPAFKILKKSLFVIKDIAGITYLRGAIIYEWKQILGS